MDSIPHSKCCTKCGKEKPLTDFYKSISEKCGCAASCKDCKKSYQLWYRNTISGDVKLATWRQSKRGKESARKSTAKPRRKRAFARYRGNNPEKVRARQVVNSTVAAGEMPHISTHICQDCELCQAEHYHHPSYDEPLLVVPLCQRCHINRHANQPSS